MSNGYLDSQYIYVLPKQEGFDEAILFSPRTVSRTSSNLKGVKRNERERNNAQ